MKFNNMLNSKRLRMPGKATDNRLAESLVPRSVTGPKPFAGLIKRFAAGPARLTQRATLPLLQCLKLNPALLRPHENKLICLLERNDGTDSFKRNTLRIFAQVDHPRSVHARLIQLCFSLLSDPTEAIAIKAFSMTILSNLACHYPGLKAEVKTVVEDLMNYSPSPGIHARGRKVLASLNKLPHAPRG